MKKALSELDKAVWAVVGSGGRVKAMNLKYAKASELIKKLEATEDSGLCVVTNDVAGRIRDGRKNG